VTGSSPSQRSRSPWPLSWDSSSRARSTSRSPCSATPPTASGPPDLTVRVAERSSDGLGTVARISNGTVELDATTTSRSFVDGIIRSMGEIILVIDLCGGVRTANRSATAIVEA
jgi:hypothetical protein